MPATVGNTTVPLPLAAHRLGLSWQQAWRAVLVRHLAGVKIGGRWHVTVASLEALEAKLAQDGAA